MLKLTKIARLILLLFGCACSAVTSTGAADQESVLPGAMVSERAALHRQILKAQEIGVGIAPYIEKFDGIEQSVKNGEDQASIKSKIDSLSRALNEQMRAYDVKNSLWVNTADPIWAPYCTEVLRAVRHNWIPPRHAVSYICVVRFDVLKDGRATNIKVTRSSGDRYSDQAAIDAVVRSAPFSKWPAVPADKSVTMEQTLNYNVQTRH
jgi:TonB family protein